jgi:ArsR family transcriptional regulator
MNVHPTTLCACLADSTRLRLLALLDSEAELCVCELVYALADIQPKISRHLALMRRDGVIVDRRDGTRIFYRLAPKLPEWGRKIIRLATSAATKQRPYRDDHRRLISMPNRPERRRAA